MYIILN